ncbi:alpha/beta hydrolase family protein [Xanthomonas theicola]|uniref:S9 family peptidase n=1 Tax=Xanthomonas theicola TaxID=56464 RepID=A0A2S6ZKZ2_9XANT|nr:prolyl oligopeptidase family serine peptidase [Xanthomonas theicola]PPT92952.1 S9 family peptidase [Xanthomonas theicola]QNH23766.1 S9 family peptidase [Xanthomonas theicola]
MKRLLGICALGMALHGGVAAAVPAPPLSDFVKRPTYSAAKISPDGEYLALTVDRGEQDVLTVLGTRDLKPIKVSVLPDNKSVGAFYWAGPHRLLFTAVKKVGSFERPLGTGEWFAVNADGTQPRTLIEYGTQSVTQRGKSVGREAFSLLDTLRDDDLNVIMQVRYPRSSEGAGTEVVMIDTLSGRRKSLGRAPKENCAIALGADKLPAFASCQSDKDESTGFDSHSEAYALKNGKWELINSSKADGARLDIAWSAADGRIYATRDDGKAPGAFGTLDPHSGRFTALFQDQVSEVARTINATDGSDVALAAVTEAGAPQVTLLDQDHPDAALYTRLAAAFPGQYVDFASATRNGDRILVSVRSDQNPGELYLYERASGKARFLMKSRPWIDTAKMATIKPIRFTARDGLVIHGYLTVPAGAQARRLPLIVNVHGGPMGPRDSWGFNPEAQMFASHGYATLQINYRGSGGFGKAFQDRAYGQWDGGIINDIVDGTQYAIRQGLADASRICIYGGSFGGYASMMAPVRAPGLFRCAFGYVGMYDAKIQLRLSDTSKHESGKRYLLRAFGSSAAEQERMSPINHVAALTLPIYLAAGARDDRCPPEHTEALARALQAAGHPPAGVIVQSGEGHGFYKEENNLNLYGKMLAFFDAHLLGAAAPAPAAATQAVVDAP